MKHRGTSHSSAVPAVRSVLPVTGLPTPPSADHHPKSSSGICKSTITASTTRHRTGIGGMKWRTRRPRTMIATRPRPGARRAPNRGPAGDADADEREHRNGQDVGDGHAARFAGRGRNRAAPDRGRGSRAGRVVPRQCRPGGAPGSASPGRRANRYDGSVELVAEGDADAVERFVEWARVGPPRAVVTNVHVIDEEPTGVRGFRVR